MAQTAQNNSSDSRDHHPGLRIEYELFTLSESGWNFYPHYHAVTLQDNLDALTVIAAAENIVLDALVMRLNLGGGTDDERRLFNLLTPCRAMREFLLAIGESEETLPELLRAHHDELVAWARAFLKEQAHQHDERRRRFGERDENNSWNPDLFSAEENEHLTATVRALENRDCATINLAPYYWDRVARLILAGKTPVEEASVQDWMDWAYALRDNRVFEDRWRMDTHHTWHKRASTDLELWAKQLMARHPLVSAVYWLDILRAHDYFPYDPARTVMVILTEAVTSKAQWQQGFDALAADTMLERPLLDWYVLQWGAGLNYATDEVAFTSPTLGTRRYNIAHEHEGDDFVLAWPPRIRIGYSGELVR